MERTGDTVFLISKYALDCQPYNTELKVVTWEECTLREWLNKNFYETAFSVEERKLITTTEVKNENNPSWNAVAGSDTKDKVFLLSVEEVEKYFRSDKEREGIMTEYAVENGVYVSYEQKTWWWLRSPGHVSYSATNVSDDGSLNRYGGLAYDRRCAVRSSLRLKL